MVRRVVKVAAVVLLLGLLVPQVAEAVAAAFTSASAGVPAVKGTNSAAANGAKGVEGYASGASGTTYGVIGTAKSPNGYGVFGQNQWGTGPAVGVYGRTPSANGRAVEGYANSTSGSQHFGGAFTALGNGSGNSLASTSGVLGHAKGVSGAVNGVLGKSDSAQGNGMFGYAPGVEGWGVVGFGGQIGTYGEGPLGVVGFGAAGVLGDSADVGDGTYGVLATTDLGVSGHFIGGGTNLAGTCTIANGDTDSGTTCTFQTAFDSAIGAPIVVLTPTSDPNGDYWVTNVAADVDGFIDGFVAHIDTAPGADLVFNFHVVGIDSSVSVTSPARAVKRARAHDKF